MDSIDKNINYVWEGENVLNMKQNWFEIKQNNSKMNNLNKIVKKINYSLEETQIWLTGVTGLW